MTVTRTFVLIALGAMLAAVAACGSGVSQVQASIGPAGGSLSLASPAVRFDVPAGALTATTTVSLRASGDAQSVLVTLEPGQLALAKPGQLSVSLDGPMHIRSVTEVSPRGEQPIGVDIRFEGSAGASTQLHLDHLTQVRVSTGEVPDGGVAPGACREHGEGMDDGSDGEHHGGEDDGEHHDGGVDDDHHSDAGTAATLACADGFECDDGVCVAPGGNDEHHDGCRSSDGGTCADDEHEHADAGHP